MRNRKPADEPKDALPNPDDVLRVMLNTPPQPHVPKRTKPVQRKKKAAK